MTASIIPPGLTGKLARARRVVALTGAGISAESGLATFRDAQTGLWAKYRPEDLATPEAFQRDGQTVWRWYTERRRQALQAEPNAGHKALAGLARLLPDLTLVTQNVDGLHQRAGSDEVIEFHGNIFVNRCFIEARDLTADELSNRTEPPTCCYCGSAVRPGVIWFGEPIPHAAIETAMAAADAADLFMSIGTSALVYPAAGLAEAALRAGAILVEVNPEPTPLTGIADYVIADSAGRVLPKLVDALKGYING